MLMKIAIGQIDMGFGEKEKTMELCSHLMTVAGEKGADLVVFPEMTLTGFTMHPKVYGEERKNSKSIAFFQAEAKKNGVAVCFGLAVHEYDVSTNRCIIIDENGSILADYGKIHLFFGAETKRYNGSNEVQFCKVKDIPLSPFICYDLRFPEPFQIASEKSHIITVIANWPSLRREHWITLLKARAIENQCFLIGVNRSGEGGKLSYSGDSLIVSPTGEVIAHVEDGSELTIVEINPSEVDAARENFPLKSDRKPELYHTLWQKHHTK
jgi:predicted amidohydrolase